MHTNIGQHTSKFCNHFLMEIFLRKSSIDTRNLFYKNFVAVKTTIPGDIRNTSSCDATVAINKQFLKPKNFLQNTFCRLKCIGETLRRKFSTRKHFWNETMITHNNNNNNNHSSMKNIVNRHTVILRSNSGLLGRLGQRSSVFTSCNAMRHTFLRTFATTSSFHSQNHFAANYDFPIFPIPKKSKSLQQLRTAIQPIAQTYLPSIPITDTRNRSEKVYRKIRNSCKSLVADLMYSFPFNTHSETDRSKESIIPKFSVRDEQKNSKNLIIDKQSSKPRHSIWSIADNFSFPNMNKRFDIETLVKPKDNVGDDDDEISITNSSLLANI